MQELNKKMEDKIILIAGAPNQLGLNIIRYFLENAATVIVPEKSLDEIKKLKAATADICSGSLITHLADIPDYDSRFDMAETIVEKFGKIDIGISIFNSLPCNTQLTESHINDWQNMIDNEITPFFVSARLILHSMKVSQGGMYISICDCSLLDEDNFAPLSKIAAGMKMEMSKIFAAEIQKYNIQYYHLWIKNNNAFLENTLGNPQTNAINSEMIGSQLMELYRRPSNQPGEVFQVFPEYNLQ